MKQNYCLNEHTKGKKIRTEFSENYNFIEFLNKFKHNPILL